MKVYSEYNLLGNKTGFFSYRKKSWTEIIESIFLSFSKEVSFKITIPEPVYTRTKLLCDLLSKKAGIPFGINDFLFTLYENFIDRAIEKQYDPFAVYLEISKPTFYDDVLEIRHNQKVIRYYKREYQRATINFSLNKKIGLKGERLLAEMDRLYGHDMKLENILSVLWQNFVEEYMQGNNQKALNQLIRLLKTQEQK